jgi:epoxyqueuosine reductase QueG
MKKINLQSEIISFLDNLGASKVGFASANKGWEMATKGCHPKDIMPNCNSVIVIAARTGLNWYTTVNFEDKSVDIDRKTYRICFLFTEWLTLKLARLLEKHGYKTALPSDWHNKEKWVNKERKISRFSFKLAAFEAGIGIFGRNGVIITPEYGPGIRLGVLLTNAELPSSGRLEGFQPCKGCYLCAELCPAEAIDVSKPPPEGFLREKCIGFIYYLRKKTQNRVRYCGICFENCPTIDKEGFQVTSHGRLESLSKNEKEQLIHEWKFHHEK